MAGHADTALVSASMITEQEVLTDQQHKGGDVHE